MKKLLFKALLFSSAFCQVKLDGQFFNYTAYYLSNFDLATGQSDVPLFRYNIYSEKYPIFAKIRFKASLLSPELGINSRTSIVEIESDPFLMKNSILIDNRNVNENTSSLVDQSLPPNIIPITFRTLSSINPSDYESVISSVITSGKLADGEYRFEISIYSGFSENDLSLTSSDDETIIVEAPSGVNLESPGGSLADTSFNVIYTPYPTFNWNKGFCRNCDTYIRIAQFKDDYHSSMEDALLDERLLPINQSKEWLKLDDVSTYQYPLSGARLLESNNTYVWQIKVEAPSTSGYDVYTSSIYAFKLKDPSQSNYDVSISIMLDAIKNAISEEEYNSLFENNGPLSTSREIGLIKKNGNTVDQSTAQDILLQISRQYFLIESIRVKE